MKADAKQARAEYMREWRRKNAERAKMHTEKYWEKKAAEKQKKEAAADAERR